MVFKDREGNSSFQAALNNLWISSLVFANKNLKSSITNMLIRRLVPFFAIEVSCHEISIPGSGNYNFRKKKVKKVHCWIQISVLRSPYEHLTNSISISVSIILQWVYSNRNGPTLQYDRMILFEYKSFGLSTLQICQ